MLHRGARAVQAHRHAGAAGAQDAFEVVGSFGVTISAGRGRCRSNSRDSQKRSAAARSIIGQARRSAGCSGARRQVGARAARRAARASNVAGRHRRRTSRCRSPPGRTARCRCRRSRSRSRRPAASPSNSTLSRNRSACTALAGSAACAGASANALLRGELVAQQRGLPGVEERQHARRCSRPPVETAQVRLRVRVVRPPPGASAPAASPTGAQCAACGCMFERARQPGDQSRRLAVQRPERRAVAVGDRIRAGDAAGGEVAASGPGRTAAARTRAARTASARKRPAFGVDEEVAVLDAGGDAFERSSRPSRSGRASARAARGRPA